MLASWWLFVLFMLLFFTLGIQEKPYEISYLYTPKWIEISFGDGTPTAV